jgi:hypothetical protein
MAEAIPPKVLTKVPIVMNFAVGLFHILTTVFDISFAKSFGEKG